MGAISAQLFHFAVARIPHAFGFGIEENHPTGALVKFFQHQMARIAIIGARIAEHQYCGFFIDRIERRFGQIHHRRAVIG